jgi:hypothetical protein
MLIIAKDIVHEREERAKSQSYEAIFQLNEMRLKTFNGTLEYLVSYNIYQFDDYPNGKIRFLRENDMGAINFPWTLAER